MMWSLYFGYGYVVLHFLSSNLESNTINVKISDQAITIFSDILYDASIKQMTNTVATSGTDCIVVVFVVVVVLWQSISQLC